MRFLVFGTGAVGGLLGARLKLAGHQVTFLARPRIVSALQHEGLTLIDGELTHHITNPHVTNDPAQALATGAPELILLCVKAYDCAEACAQIQGARTDPIPVLSLLNGISNERTIEQSLGAQNVIPATLTTAVQMPSPGVVKVARRRGLGVAGSHPMVDQTLEHLQQAGFRASHFNNADRMKWSKLMTNIVSNASSAITGYNPAEVFAHRGLARMEIDALRETVRVMRKLGFKPQDLPGVSVSVLGYALSLPDVLIRALLGRIVARGRGTKKPSLSYDIGRGKSEVDWLNGAVVRFGAPLGVRTPVNRALNEVMQEIVEDRRVHERYLNRPERLLARAYSSKGAG